jgi:hypothetical protein
VHEGNIARYRLRLPEFQAWKKNDGQPATAVSRRIPIIP